MLKAILFSSLIAAWITHCAVCIKAGTIGLLLAGAIFFPVGIIHGFGLLFGIF